MRFELPFTGLLSKLIIPSILFSFVTLAEAGKNSYPEFLPVLARGAIQILQEHDMPVVDNRENPWLFVSGVPGDYTLKFHRSDEIPWQAVLDVINFCFEVYEKRGEKDQIRIVAYTETHKEWRESWVFGIGYFSSVKPVLQVAIGKNE